MSSLILLEAIKHFMLIERIGCQRDEDMIMASLSYQLGDIAILKKRKKELLELINYID